MIGDNTTSLPRIPWTTKSNNRSRKIVQGSNTFTRAVTKLEETPKIGDICKKAIKHYFLPMATNLGFFESPNGHHSDRSYQIRCQKKIPHRYLITLSKVGGPFWPIYQEKQKNSDIIGGVSLLELPRGHWD